MALLLQQNAQTLALQSAQGTQAVGGAVMAPAEVAVDMVRR
jgi:hypothetical protein